MRFELRMNIAFNVVEMFRVFLLKYKHSFELSTPVLSTKNRKRKERIKFN
jgi:hypothetical protein